MYDPAPLVRQEAVVVGHGFVYSKSSSSSIVHSL